MVKGREPCGHTAGAPGGETGRNLAKATPCVAAGDPPGSAGLTDDPLRPEDGVQPQVAPAGARPWALPRRPRGGACRLEEVAVAASFVSLKMRWRSCEQRPQGGWPEASQGARPQHRCGARLPLRRLSSAAKVRAFW